MFLKVIYSHVVITVVFYSEGAQRELTLEETLPTTVVCRMALHIKRCPTQHLLYPLPSLTVSGLS